MIASLTKALAIASALLLVTTAGAVASEAVTAGPVRDWQQTEVKSFYGLDAATKTQGMASDGSRMFFSWNLGLHSTDLGMDTHLAENLTGIPHDLSVKGSNHIGDIDFYDGKIYAPIEDGPGYLSPTMVIYEAATLRPGPERYILNRDKLTFGAPWVAIDPERQVAYTAQWDDTTEINVHQLSDFAITSTIPLDREVPRIQGAKIYRGYLYAARDNGAEKSVVAINLETGHVSYLFNRDLGLDHEVEGMAFVTNDGGTTLRMADIVQSDNNRVDIHGYRVAGDVTPPVIDDLKVLPRKFLLGPSLKVEVTSSEDVTGDATWSRCVGSKKRPCRKLGTARPAPLLNIRTGTTVVKVPIARRYATKGALLSPGRYKLTVTPVDIADARGRPVSANVKLLFPGR